MIILLNGVSSVGKSSIARAIQSISDKIWIHIGFDTFADMIHPKFIEFGERAAEGFEFIQTTNAHGQFVTNVTSSPIGVKIAESIPETVAILANKGLDVIVDECLFDNEIDRYKNTFNASEICYVGVMCDLETIEIREKARGDRILGLARGMFDRIHKIEYDLMVDTAKMDATSCGKKILEFVGKMK